MKIFPIGKWLGKKQLNFGLFHVNFPYPLKYFDWEMAREKGVASGSFRVNFMLCQHGTYPYFLYMVVHLVYTYVFALMILVYTPKYMRALKVCIKILNLNLSKYTVSQWHSGPK